MGGLDFFYYDYTNFKSIGRRDHFPVHHEYNYGPQGERNIVFLLRVAVHMPGLLYLLGDCKSYTCVHRYVSDRLHSCGANNGCYYIYLYYAYVPGKEEITTTR